MKPSRAYFCVVSLTTSFVIGCGTILATIPPASGASKPSDTRTDTARKVRALARSSSTLGETMASAQGEVRPDDTHSAMRLRAEETGASQRSAHGGAGDAIPSDLRSIRPCQTRASVPNDGWQSTSQNNRCSGSVTAGETAQNRTLPSRTEVPRGECWGAGPDLSRAGEIRPENCQAENAIVNGVTLWRDRGFACCSFPGRHNLVRAGFAVTGSTQGGVRPVPAALRGTDAAGSYRIMARNARRLCGITSRDDVSRFYRLIERESGWRHYGPDGKVLRSSSGALGLGQVKPATALAFAPSDIREPFGNLLVSACLFQSYYQKRGNWRDAVLDYRLGPNRKGTTMAARAYSNTIIGGAQ